MEEGGRCGACRYWDGGWAQTGYCVRYAPRSEVVDLREGEDWVRNQVVWPSVGRWRWCGEWEAREHAG
jgi:hypothetical protein